MSQTLRLESETGTPFEVRSMKTSNIVSFIMNSFQLFRLCKPSFKVTILFNLDAHTICAYIKYRGKRVM